MKKHIFILLLLLPAVCVAQEADPSELLINEVQVANIDQYLDKANCYGSWIELYNPSEADIPLSPANCRIHLLDNEHYLALVEDAVFSGNTVKFGSVSHSACVLVNIK